MTFTTRQEMISSLPKGLRCAELGVFGAEFSGDIQRIMEPRVLYLVDLFHGYFSSADQNGIRPVTLYLPDIWNVLYSCRPLGLRVIPVRAESVRWLKEMPADSLDFVYIDTTHSYEQTKAEIRESMRVVSPGGWIAGHDYHERFEGVIEAVNEWKGLYRDTTEDGLPSWMLQKPDSV